MPIQNNHVAEPFQSILNNICVGKKPEKPVKLSGHNLNYGTNLDFDKGIHNGKIYGADDMWDKWELWLKEVFSVENIKEVMLKTPHKVDSLWTPDEIAKAIHNLTKEQ